MIVTRYRTADVDGLKIFYRKAGRADSATLLLLHGLPSAAHTFPRSDPTSRPSAFHLVAPDRRALVSRTCHPPTAPSFKIVPVDFGQLEGIAK